MTFVPPKRSAVVIDGDEASVCGAPVEGGTGGSYAVAAGGASTSPSTECAVSKSTPSVGTSVIPNIATPMQHRIMPTCI